MESIHPSTHELKPMGQEKIIEYQVQPFLKYRLAFTFGLLKANIALSS